MKKNISTLRRAAIFLFSVILIFILAGAALWWTLKKGIDIDRISIGRSEVRQLFLKHDQGLIIHIGQIKLAREETAKGDTVLDVLLPRIKKWGYLVREIEIDETSYLGHTVAITYRGGDFSISGDRFSLASRITYAMGAFFFEIKRLEIKPQNLTFFGEASYVLNEKRFLYSGNFVSLWGKGGLRIAEKDGQVDARVTNVDVTDLGDFLRLFPLEEETVDWVDENISAGSYRINTLNAAFSLGSLEDIDPANIRGDAVAEKAAVRFHPALSPVRSDSVKITLQDDRLLFIPVNPVYKDKNLSGSRVFLENVIMPDSILAVEIRTGSRLDDTVLDLLKIYDFDLPLRQLSGMTRGEVNLFFDPPEFTLNTTGRLETGTGEWTWGDYPLLVNKAVVLLEDDKMTIEYADVRYKDVLSTVLSGRINLSSRQASLESAMAHLQISAQEKTILQASQIKVPLEVDFSSESTSVTIGPYGTHLTIDEQKTTIDMDDLKAVAPFVPYIQDLSFTRGDIHITLTDSAHMSFAGEMEIPNTLLTLEEKPVTLFRFQGTSSPEQTEITVNQGEILIDISDRVEVALNDYLAIIRYDEVPKSKKLPFPLEIKGAKSLLQVKDMQIPTRDFTSRIANGDMYFHADLDQGSFQFRSAGGRIRLTGAGLDAKLLEEFIHFSDLSGGIFDVSLVGDSLGFNGYLTFGNVIIRDYLLMYNLLAFLNSIPALATFSEPGFDADGYRVEEGIVHFDLQGGLLTIRQLVTEGTTVNCEAYGWIDFNSRTLQMQMELIALKDYSKIIDMLPWANYALLGDDGSLSTSVKIDGSLDEPTIKTFLARDLVMTPINVLKRTIEWPFKIFNDRVLQEKEPSEWTPIPMVPDYPQ